MQYVVHLMKIEERGNRGCGTAFHVAGPTSVDTAVDQGATPRILRPAGAVAYGEDVDMTIEGEVSPWPASRKRRDDIRHRLLWCDDTMLHATLAQQSADMCCRLARVTRWVWTWATDEPPQELNQYIAAVFDPLQQLRFAAFRTKPPGAGLMTGSSARLPVSGHVPQHIGSCCPD